MKSLPMLLMPPILTIALAMTYRSPTTEAPRPVVAQAAASQDEGAGGRMVLIIVDSLRSSTLDKPGVMPVLHGLATGTDVVRLPFHTCAANFTLPCVQTLMEGRQSPFVAGLSNFTGMEGGDVSITRALHDMDVPFAVVGDHTLPELYGRDATWAYDIETAPGDYVERDLAGISKAVGFLDDARLKALFLHIPGTDKAAHYKKPGTALYDEHFRTVDAALAPLLAKLDPRRDTLLVMGDHGHDENGDHVRESVILLRGALANRFVSEVAPAPAVLGEEEVVFFISYVLMLPVTPDYEGRFFLPEGAGSTAPGRLGRFHEMLRSAYEAQGFPGTSLAAAVDGLPSHSNARIWRLLGWIVPFFVLFTLWIVAMAAPIPTRRAWMVTALVVAGAVAASRTVEPWLSNLLGAPFALGAFWLVRPWRVRTRAWFWVLVVALASAGGLFARDWADLMHSRHTANVQLVLAHLLLPAVGAVVAWAWARRTDLFPEGAMILCLFALPSGPYYYQSGRNLLAGYGLGLAVALAGRLWHRVRRDGWASTWRSGKGRWAAALLVVPATVSLLSQDAGGWEWRHLLVVGLTNAGPVVATGAIAVVGALILALVDTLRARVAVALVVAAAAAYCCGVAELPPGVLATALTVPLFVACSLHLRGGDRGQVDGRAAGPWTEGLLLAGACLWVMWILFHAFYLNHIDFHFGFALFGDIARERDQAGLIFAATVVKYGLPVFVLLLVARLLRGHVGARELVLGALFFFDLKLLCLGAQAVLARLGTSEKLYELAVADAFFLLGTVLVVAGSWGVLALAGAAWDRVRRPREVVA